jgi:hypothetical protein
LKLKGVLPLAGFTCTHPQFSGTDSVTAAPLDGFALLNDMLLLAGAGPPIACTKSSTAGVALSTVRSVTARFTCTAVLEFCGPEAEMVQK